MKEKKGSDGKLQKRGRKLASQERDGNNNGMIISLGTTAFPTVNPLIFWKSVNLIFWKSVHYIFWKSVHLKVGSFLTLIFSKSVSLIVAQFGISKIGQFHILKIGSFLSSIIWKLVNLILSQLVSQEAFLVIVIDNLWSCNNSTICQKTQNQKFQ